MADLQLDNSEIVRSCLQVMGLGRDAANMDPATEADVRAVMRAGLRRFYFPTIDGNAYQWRWLEKAHAIPANDTQSTGTIAVASGVITLSGSTWPSWILDGFIRVSNQVLFISSLSSGSPTTVANTTHTQLTIAAGTAYVAYRYRYPLPSDFSEWIGGVVYQKGTDSWLLAKSSEDELRLRYAIGQGTNSRTTHYDITSTPDADGDYLMVWPVPEVEAIIQGTYLSTPDDNLPADLTTPGSTVQVQPIYAQCLVEAILAEAESFYNNSNGLHEAKFQAALKAAIMHDKSAGGAYDFSRSLSKQGNYRQVLPIDFTDALI